MLWAALWRVAWRPAREPDTSTERVGNIPGPTGIPMLRYDADIRTLLYMAVTTGMLVRVYILGMFSDEARGRSMRLDRMAAGRQV